MRKKLTEVAKRATVITYGDLGAIFGYDMKNPDERNQLYYQLGEISWAEHDKRRPLLSSVVVHKDDNMPGGGFFSLAKDAGLMKGNDKDVFFAQELNRLYEYWRSH